MIAVDPSALFVVLLSEAEMPAYTTALSENALVMATPSMVELHVGAWRKAGPDLRDAAIQLVSGLGVQLVDFDDRLLAEAQRGYDQFGKGRGIAPAALNFGDCFSYALAIARDIPLLFKGKDFAQTDAKVFPVQ